MFLLTVSFSQSGLWAFLFNSEEHARVAYDNLSISGHEVEIVDDHGQTATFNPTQVTAYMLEDLEKSKIAMVERSLHHARIQAKANQQAQADPVIRSAASGPAVLQPGMMRMNG